MIVDRFENASIYFNKDSKLYKAVSYAYNFDKTAADGRYEVDGDEIFALYKTYRTDSQSNLKFESHRKYIDIQVMTEGAEYMLHSLEKHPAVMVEYDPAKDVRFYRDPEIYSSSYMKPGYFIIFFPEDLHKPNCMVVNPAVVKKLVVKVKL